MFSHRLRAWLIPAIALVTGLGLAAGAATKQEAPNAQPDAPTAAEATRPPDPGYVLFLDTGKEHQWSPPEGVQWALVRGVGGGGGGGGGGSTRRNLAETGSGGGGAGAAVSLQLVGPLTAATYTIVVGSGGAGGNPGVNGENGHPSKFGEVSFAGGGHGGYGANGGGSEGGDGYHGGRGGNKCGSKSPGNPGQHSPFAAGGRAGARGTSTYANGDCETGGGGGGGGSLGPGGAGGQESGPTAGAQGSRGGGGGGGLLNASGGGGGNGEVFVAWVPTFTMSDQRLEQNYGGLDSILKGVPAKVLADTEVKRLNDRIQELAEEIDKLRAAIALEADASQVP